MLVEEMTGFAAAGWAAAGLMEGGEEQAGSEMTSASDVVRAICIPTNAGLTTGWWQREELSTRLTLVTVTSASQK